MTGPEQHANTVSRPDPAQVEAAMGRINGYFLRDHGSIPSDAKLVAAELVAVRAELAEARREVDLQMQEKLDAQSLLANLVEAIGLSRSDFDLSDTWRTVGPGIIARLSEIVDTAEHERAAREAAERARDEARDDLSAERDAREAGRHLLAAAEADNRRLLGLLQRWADRAMFAPHTNADPILEETRAALVTGAAAATGSAEDDRLREALRRAGKDTA